MVVILKEVLPLVFAGLLLLASPESIDAASNGIRGVNRNQQLDSLATSTIKHEDTERQLRKKGRNCLDRKGKGKGKKCKDNKRLIPSASSGTIAGRFNIPVNPAPTPVPGPPKPTVNTWIGACAREDKAINTCSPDTHYICESCLFALSTTSTTPTNAVSGVNSCKRQYCERCSTEELLSFFNCGWKINNPDQATVTEDNFPSSEIRTPPPIEAAKVAESEDEDDIYTDKVNCPAVYPRSGTECEMIGDFKFKECSYYELGPNVMCACSLEQLVYSCTGTIVSNGFSAEKEDLTTVIEKETELQAPPLLPGADVIISRIDDVEPMCPNTTPMIGDTCTTAGFYEIECCYNTPTPVPDTLGTVTCTCDSSGVWGCKGGSLSTCTL